MLRAHRSAPLLAALADAGITNRLGLGQADLDAILQALCEDLLLGAQGAACSLASCIDADLIDNLLGDIDDIALQDQVLSALLTVAAADGHLSEGEQILIDRAHGPWHRTRDQPPVPVTA